MVFRFVLLALLGLPSVIMSVLMSQTGKHGAGQALFGGWALLTLGSAYISRRKPWGGWMAFFVASNLVGVVTVVVGWRAVLTTLLPSNAFDSLFYVWDASTHAAAILSLLLATGFALHVMRSPSAHALTLLRFAVLAQMVAFFAQGVVAFAFGEHIAPFVLPTAMSAVWGEYLRRSNRVRAAFVDLSWRDMPTAHMSLAERRYRWRRAGLFALVAFVAFFLLFGFLWRGSPPDSELFVQPALMAAMFLLLGWYGPITVQKRARLEALQA